MSTRTILALQTALVMLQILNGGLATLHASATATLFVSIFIGGFQFCVQHLGNQTDPGKQSPLPPAA